MNLIPQELVIRPVEIVVIMGVRAAVEVVPIAILEVIQKAQSLLQVMTPLLTV